MWFMQKKSNHYRLLLGIFFTVIGVKPSVSTAIILSYTLYAYFASPTPFIISNYNNSSFLKALYKPSSSTSSVM